MTELKKLLEERLRIRKRKPDFLRTDGHKKTNMDMNWRAPKGVQNKMRHQKRGYRRIVKAGWGSPVLVRGTDAQGRIPVIISTVAEMERLDPKKNCIIVSSKVGLKRALVLIEAAKAKKIEVLNISDESLSKRKGARDASIAARESARSEKSKKVKEAEKKSEKVAADKAELADEDPEEKKRKEKEERDSIITKRES